MAKQEILAAVIDGDQVRKLVQTGRQLVDATTGDKITYWQKRNFHRLLWRQAAAYEKWYLSVCTNDEYLQVHNATPEVEGGQIIALHFHFEFLPDEPYEPSTEQYARLELDPADLGCVEPHPEGADRGGYVPTLTNGCHYNESSCEWQG